MVYSVFPYTQRLFPWLRYPVLRLWFGFPFFSWVASMLFISFLSSQPFLPSSYSQVPVFLILRPFWKELHVWMVFKAQILILCHS